MNRARVHWRIINTGQTGHGNPISADAARAWADMMNEKYRGVIEHWVVEES